MIFVLSVCLFFSNFNVMYVVIKEREVYVCWWRYNMVLIVLNKKVKLRIIVVCELM